MTTRINKQEQIDLVKDRFSKAAAAVLLELKGLDMEVQSTLRARFRKAGVEYRVVKNNLVRQALKGTALEAKDELDKGLIGPTGIAWSFEDPSAAAKVIKAFRKEADDVIAEKVVVKCGIVGEDILSGKRVEAELATLPGKNEVRAMLLATLQAPAQNLVLQLKAPSQNFAFVLDAKQRQG